MKPRLSIRPRGRYFNRPQYAPVIKGSGRLHDFVGIRYGACLFHEFNRPINIVIASIIDPSHPGLFAKLFDIFPVKSLPLFLVQAYECD